MIRTQLSVNLNKVALVRNSREGNWPDPVFFGRIALEAGAAGLTVHPRPDERHIRRTDLAPLKALVDAYPGREFNIERESVRKSDADSQGDSSASGDVCARCR